MSEREQIRQEALEALQGLPGRYLDQAAGSVNSYLEDAPCPTRAQQSLAFVAEVFLQGGNGQGDHIVQDMTEDALEGLGWILEACQQSLDTVERLRVLEHRECNVESIRK